MRRFAAFLLLVLAFTASAFANLAAAQRARTPQVEIDARGTYTCAVIPDGRIKCWGSNNFGQLGNGSVSEYEAVPAEVVGISTAVAVSTRYDHTCALLRGGRVSCWGSNKYGQLGDGGFVDSPKPRRVLGISNATAVATGVFHSCALIADGSVRCWGYNGYGQLGDETFTNSPVPVTVRGLAGAMSISAGGDHNCSVMRDRRIKCWGWNAQGQIGAGLNDENVLHPATVSGITNAVSVSNGDYHTCALLKDGEVRCWGLNGESAPSAELVVPPFSPAEGAPLITSAASLDSGVAISWRAVEGASTYNVYYAPSAEVSPDNYQSLGGGVLSNITSTSAEVTNLRNATPYTFVITADTANGPTPPSAPLTIVPQTQTNVSPTVAVERLEGRLKLSWSSVGGGASYSIYYATAGHPTPQNFLSLPDGKSIRGIRGTTAEIHDVDNDAEYRITVTANYSGFEDGQLGNGRYSNSNVPVTVSGISNAVQVEAGYANSCAVISDGTVKCWGRNLAGQLVYPTTLASSNTPLPVPGISDVTDLSVGATPCVVQRGELVKCWGLGGSGERRSEGGQGSLFSVDVGVED